MPIDPVGLGVGGAATLISLIMDQQAKQAGVDLAAQNLNSQRRNADRMYRLGTSTHTDAYGNAQRYDDALNKWITELAPMQQRLVKAGEREQLLSLTEDAARNRDVRRRAGSRAEQAGQDYGKARAEFTYGGPKSEGATRSELLDLLAGSADATRRRSMDATNALRTEGSMPVPSSGEPLADIILKARQGALGETGTRTSAHASKYLPILQNLSQTMDAVGDAPIRFSSTPQEMSARQDSMAQLMQSALQTGGQLTGNAGQNLSKLMFQAGPDMRGLASMYNAFSTNDTGSKADKATAARGTTARGRRAKTPKIEDDYAAPDDLKDWF